MVAKKKSDSQPSAFKFDARELSIEKLLLDPNNYRFLNAKKFKKKVASRFHEPSVQSATLSALEHSYNLDELKQSILVNGYVPMERIIVVPYKAKAGFYLVIEGNRRVACLKSLIKEDSEGVHKLSPSQRKGFATVPCAVLKGQGASLKHVERVIMGIRHIAGPKEWGAYQQAILVSELKDDEGLEFSDIAEILGISSVEAARRYRAIGALKFMEQDELFAKKAEPEFYKLFHELVSVPEVRKRFGWSSENSTFEDKDKARQFFELITSEGTHSPKVQSYSDVRKLRSVVNNSSAEEVLFDPEMPLKEAFQIADYGKKSKDAATLLEQAKAILDQIGVAQAGELGETGLTLIAKMISLLESLKTLGGG